MDKRWIDANQLIADLKEFVENIKNIREDSKCFLTEENVLSIIDEQPTAYDVDKVMEQLKKQVYEIDDSLSLSARDVIDEEDAFEIVKAGGIDNVHK